MRRFTASLQMIVIADTSPINYLVLIGEIDVLQKLFSRVILPEGVFDELQSDKAPKPVKEWITALPAWCEIKPVKITIESELERLGLGERQAIMLAKHLGADLLIVDDRAGVREALKRNLRVAGTLFVLEEAAVRGFLNLSEAITKLQQTSFRVSPKIIQQVLERSKD